MTTEKKKLLTASVVAFFLLRDFEKFAAVPYNDGVGKMTVGYGHVILPGEVFEYPMSKKFAEELLRKDVEKHQDIIYRYVKVPLTQEQHDALVCFVFNIGEGTFASSGLLKVLNEGKYDEAITRLNKYIKGTNAQGQKFIMKGLVRRRAAETQVWNGTYRVTA